MPQDGSGNYQYPPGTPGVPDQTIESEAYNTFIDDLITNDLNIARPIHRGGTGAVNAIAARTNLGAEAATAQVTNYDSHVFESGSFWSAAAATGAPLARVFSGTAVVVNQSFINIEVRSLDAAAPVAYSRQKDGGVWKAWTQVVDNQADADARYVNLTGDNMTGTLNVLDQIAAHSATNAFVRVNSVVGNFSVFGGQKAGKNRWEIYPGNSEAETGGNTGSNFNIVRVDDAGTTILGYPLTINRATGTATFEKNIIIGPAGFTQYPSVSGGNQFKITHSPELNLSWSFNDSAPIMTLANSAALTLLGGGGGVILNKSSSGQQPVFAGQTAGLNRWVIFPGDAIAEGGANTGSNFGIWRCNDAGAFIDPCIQIERSTGRVLLSAPVASPTQAATKQYVDTSKLNPGVMKVGVLADVFGGVGFSYGVSSTVDTGIGYVDVNYAVSFAGTYTFSAVAAVHGLSINCCCNTSSGPTATRIHCITATTGGLVDPSYYHLWVGGTQ